MAKGTRNNDLKAMKENAESTLRWLRTIVQQLEYDEQGERVRKGTRLNKRIDAALAGTDDGVRMIACREGTGGECGSVWCMKCRGRKQDRMLKSYYKHIDEEALSEPDARERLRHVTVLHDVVGVFDEGGLIDFEKTISHVCEVADDMRNAVKNMKRVWKKRGMKVWMRGGIHLELVDVDLMLFDKAGNHKAKVLLDWFDNKKVDGRYCDGSAENAIVVHFHALVDLHDIDEDDFRDALNGRWNDTEQQVHIQRTWTRIGFKDGSKEQSLDDALKGIARYCFTGSNKDLQYQKFWGAGRLVFETDIELDDDGKVIAVARELQVRPTGKRLTASEIRLLVQVHNRVAGEANRGLTIGIY